MLGFIIGTACLVGFIGVWRAGHHRHLHRSLHRWLLHKLDASPGQERILRNAFESIRSSVMEFAEGGKTSRRELAELLREPAFDHQRVNDWFVAREHEFAKVRQSAVSALAEAHEVLDDRQRESLAKLIERGAYFRGCHHGPYRSRATEAA
ncbi:MAG TPA: periplasmic heavy metal sensor [Polyangiaceae bacterium]|nr:periplasmic heavy metal sensor [Polyangiaceae bacterium]